MSLLAGSDEFAVEPEDADEPLVDRPARWSIRNWPVQWKVLAIALVPMLLAGVFGGLRISNALADAGRLRTAADNAELVPAINDYLVSLGGALVAASTNGDVQGAEKNFENRRDGLNERLDAAEAPADVRSAVAGLVSGGESLLAGVLSGGVGLRDEVTAYAPILLTAEDAINGSVRVEDQKIRTQAEGLSRAIGARGQMLMQGLLVNRGGELDDQELRMAMIAVAGTEPSTLFGMSQVLGVDSLDAKTLQRQMMGRLSILSNPESVLPNNVDLRNSIRTTDGIAERVIEMTTRQVTTTLSNRAAERRTEAIRDIVAVLTVLAAALLVVWLVARSLVRPLRTLRDSALRVAHTDLEDEINRVRSGDEREPDPLPVYTTEEIGQVAHAVDELHSRALLLAGDEARLRLLVNEMFETMSRRNRSLVDQQLSLIDRLERNEEDPDRLDNLFQLDHLAARMRRNGANLMVLADARSTADSGRALPLSAVLSAAVSEVEAYQRVQLVAVPDVMVTGVATGDVIHLLAELIDNALRYSPPTSPVQLSAEMTRGGTAVVEVIDSGLGMTAADLRMANTRLEAGGEVSPKNARHMGLFVVGRLAKWHGITVRLSPVRLAARGIVAEVHLPSGLLRAGRDAPPQPRPGTVASRPTEAVAAPSTPSRNGSTAVAASGSALPQRAPGASGITGAPVDGGVAAGATGPAGADGTAGLTGPDGATDTAGLTGPTRGDAAAVADGPGVTDAPDRPTGPAVTPRTVTPVAAFTTTPAAPVTPMSGSTVTPDRRLEPDPAEPLSGPMPAVRPGMLDEDLIYQRMLSEWLTDPHDLGRSPDLDWKSVWDHGWSTAAEAENVPIVAHTATGLPMREPGARLVPGAAEVPAAHAGAPAGAHAGAHRRTDSEEWLQSDKPGRHPSHRAPERDPEAIRASISSHFSGVHAARARARAADADHGGQG